VLLMRTWCCVHSRGSLIDVRASHLTRYRMLLPLPHNLRSVAPRSGRKRMVLPPPAKGRMLPLLPCSPRSLPPDLPRNRMVLPPPAKHRMVLPLPRSRRSAQLSAVSPASSPRLGAGIGSREAGLPSGDATDGSGHFSGKSAAKASAAPQPPSRAKSTGASLDDFDMVVRNVAAMWSASPSPV
jgi:hypothetical protein